MPDPGGSITEGPGNHQSRFTSQQDSADWINFADFGDEVNLREASYMAKLDEEGEGIETMKGALNTE